MCAVILLSHPAQKGQLITAHIIDIRPRKTKLLPKPGLSPAPCKQRRRSASRLRSRAVKLHGFWTSACCRHEDLEKSYFSNWLSRDFSRSIGAPFNSTNGPLVNITYSSLGTLHQLHEILQQENGVLGLAASRGPDPAGNRSLSRRHLRTVRFSMNRAHWRWVRI